MGNNNSDLRDYQCQDGQGESSKTDGSSEAQVSLENLSDSVSSQESIELKEIVVIPPKCIMVGNCADIFQYLSSIHAANKPQLKVEISSCVKFMSTGEFSEISSEDLQKLSKECKDNSAVILLESKREEIFSIYWKSKELTEFLILDRPNKVNFEAAQKLNEYVSDFLVDSLNKNHSGLISEFSPQPVSKPINLDLLADSRDYNLLLLAAEQGNTEIVEILLQLEINPSSLDNRVHAQTLAINGQHFDVLNILLQNNLKFPNNFDASKCTGKLKEFCDVTEDVHRLIRANEKEKLEEILDQHQNLRHFYNFSNESALKVAIECGSLDIFDILLSKQFRFGSHENPAEYYEQMDTKSKRTVRDIQHKYAQPFLDKHIHTLMSNSTACYDETEAKDKIDYIQRAFTLLSENPLIRIILKIVSASKNFKIVFDFNREAVNVVDPTTTESTQGIFYFSGKIFIGAKQLLNPLTEHETLAVLAHELCHFVMKLVYENKAKPYRSADKKTANEFEEVSADCEEKSEEEEEVIGSIYKCYPEGSHHAELIVRVVHLLALNRNLPEKLKELRGIFIKLFEFYEKKIVPELEKALPEIEGRDEKELKKKDKKISKFKKMSMFGGILAMVGVIAAITVGLVFYTPIYKFNELSVDDQKAVAMAPIIYKNTRLEFRDLFPENSTVYENITSDHISQMLEMVPLSFNDPHLSYLNNLVIHNWQNLTAKLKDKFLTSNFTFQNESLKFEKLHEINSKVFISLTSEQILDVLSDKKLVVHKMIKNETKFYFERRFKNEKEEDSSEFDFEHVLKLANESRLFILSAEAGIGKTETFEQFTMKIKKKFSTQWVSYIDLKDHKTLYREVRNLKNVKRMLEKIFELSSETNLRGKFLLIFSMKET